ncbi:hypothetical protein QQ045_018949 [Rhodiola kirilowii]
MESSKRNSTVTKTILDLPSDQLLLILSLLDQDDLRSLSLVSKPFLILSNHFVRKLTFKTLPNDSTFRKIFARYSSVNRIVIQSTRIVRALTAIANSKLNLEALKIMGHPAYPKQHDMLSLAGRLKIKSLGLDWFSKVTVDQLIEFIQLFPALEALHFGVSMKLNDDWVERLSLVLPNIRKIDIERNFQLTDRSLYALSANCVNLERIGIGWVYEFTPDGFCNFLLRNRNLKYLELPFLSQFQESVLLLAEAISACDNLHHLSIRSPLIRDDTLVTIAKSRASLTSLKMRVWNQEQNMAYSLTGLSAMLSAFQGLTRLEVRLPLPDSNNFLDKKMSELVKSLPCLNGIVIESYCPIYATLFSLIENCPLLECISIKMDVPAPDQEDYTVPVPQLIRKNYSVKYIKLDPSPVDSFKIALESFCPFLKNWNVWIPMETFFPKNPALDWM